MAAHCTACTASKAHNGCTAWLLPCHLLHSCHRRSQRKHEPFAILPHDTTRVFESVKLMLRWYRISCQPGPHLSYIHGCCLLEVAPGRVHYLNIIALAACSAINTAPMVAPSRVVHGSVSMTTSSICRAATQEQHGLQHAMR